VAYYLCRRCNHRQDTAWPEECPKCGGFYRPQRRGSDRDEHQVVSFAAVPTEKVEFVPTGLAGFDQVLGGGLVARDLILMAGYRGTGKTRLLLQVACELAKTERALYASSEQHRDRLLHTAQSIGAASDQALLVGGQEAIEDTLELVHQVRPFAVVYDSVQRYYSRKCSAPRGSTAQGNAVIHAIKEDCDGARRCAILVNQMTGSGSLRGGEGNEHDVDVILLLGFPKADDEEAPPPEGDRAVVSLFYDKNRHAGDVSKSYWRWTTKGALEHVPPQAKVIEIHGRRRRRE
jgi:DNA repair protein RadA/Sms